MYPTTTLPKRKIFPFEQKLQINIQTFCLKIYANDWDDVIPFRCLLKYILCIIDFFYKRQIALHVVLGDFDVLINSV